LFDVNKGCGDGTPLYLLNDKGYPLLNEAMTPFKEQGTHTIFELLYIRKHK
jgi:hypothetical protein